MKVIARLLAAGQAGILMLLLLVAGAGPVAATAGPGAGLATALGPDGTLRPGADGSYDAQGYSMSIAPDGHPVFRPASAQGVGDEKWRAGFGGVAGANNTVYAVAQRGADLYVGGIFTMAGTTPAASIARWDGTAWSSLGAGLTYSGTNNGVVNALAVAPSGDLYAGGAFNQAGSVAANNIARWDGTAWSSVGTGAENGVGTTTGGGYSPVMALAVANTGDVYVGGTFGQAGTTAASRVAKWDGSAWSALGAGIGGTTTTFVRALAVLGTTVYAGGNFTQAGGLAANGVARWTGVAWSALGTGSANGIGTPGNNTVAALCVLNGSLYIGGSFSTAGGQPASNVARWDGAAWNALGAGIAGPVYTLAVLNNAVCAGGTFDAGYNAGTTGGCVAQWNGSTWTSLSGGGATGVTGPVERYGYTPRVLALAALGGSLYVGGEFSRAGATTTTNVARWTGAAWGSLGTTNSVLGTVRAVAVAGTTVYIGGDFTQAGGVNANCVARWDGSSWSSLGTGAANGVLGVGQDYPSVKALAVLGNYLYVGGHFTGAGGTSAYGIARWDGSAWSALGAGTRKTPFGSQQPGTVFALTVWGGALYVGGAFDLISGVAANNLARWDGSTWTALGAGLTSDQLSSSPEFPAVLSLAVVGTTLYAGGNFNLADGAPASNLARWNGTAWSGVVAGTANGTNATVRALAAAGPQLYVGGDFSTAGALTASYVARWDGNAWASLGTGAANGINSPAYALATSGPAVYVGGFFTQAGGQPAARVAKWDGTGWTTLGTGLNGQVTALLAAGTTVYAGGGFSAVGDGSRLTLDFGIYDDVVPAISSFTPTSGPANTTSVTLTGQLLTGASAVTFNGTAATGYTVNAAGTQLVVTVPNGASTGPIVVTTPNGTATSPTSFTVTGQGPLLSSFAPAFTRSGQTVTITGQNLAGATVLKFSGVSQPTFSVNAAGTEITAQVPYSGNATYPGLTSGSVQVTTGAGTATSATPLRLLAISSAVTAVDGNPFGLMAQSVNITGSGFGGGTVQFALAYPSVVTFPVTYTVVDETHLTATVPDVSGTTAKDGHGSWLVTNTPGTADANYELLSPVVTSISPANAPAGTVVTVTGFNFVHNDIRPGYPHYNQLSTITGFDFNSAHGTNFQLVGPTGSYAQYQAKITVPAGLSGPVYVQATGGYLQGGGQIQGYYFGGAALPTLTGSSASSGPVGSTLTLNGTDLTGASVITFAGAGNNTVTAGYTVNMVGTQITGIIVPNGATTGNVTVTTPGGITNGLAFTITYPDLTISTGTATSPVAIAPGTYNSITISGVAALTGSTVVNASITVSGALGTNCQSLTGAASFTLAAGGILGICDPAGLSSVAGQGAIQTTGQCSFSPAASYLYNGTAAQATGNALPPQVLNLATLNAQNVTLTQPVRVKQVVSVGAAGNLVLNGQALTLLSDASGTALVANTGSGVVQGATGTMQRYIDASANTGTSGYRHYSAPVSGSTVADLATTATGGSFAPTVNGAYNTSATPGTVSPFPTVYGYDETRLATSPATGISAFDKGFYSPTATTDALVPGRGYTVQIGNSELVDFTGTFTTGPQTISGLTRGPAPDAGWALVGNPYPAPLDWGTVSSSQLTGLDAAIYLSKSTAAYAGQYRSLVNGVGAGTSLVPAGQGFFVRTSAAGSPGSIALTNANRVSTFGTQPAVQRPAADPRPLLRLSLSPGAQPATVATAQDEAFVYFEAGATAGFDGLFDAYKLLNSNGYYLATATPGSSPVGLSVDGRVPLSQVEEVIPLWLGAPAGSYTLTATELSNFASLAGGTSVYLRDALTGTFIDLGRQPSYHFGVAAGAAYSGRFALVFRPAAALGTTASASPSQALATLYPNPAAPSAEVVLAVTGLPATTPSLDVTLFSALGQQVARYPLAASQGAAQLHLTTAGLASGVYLLRLVVRDAQGQAVGQLPAQRLDLR